MKLSRLARQTLAALTLLLALGSSAALGQTYVRPSKGLAFDPFANQASWSQYVLNPIEYVDPVPPPGAKRQVVPGHVEIAACGGSVVGGSASDWPTYPSLGLSESAIACSSAYDWSAFSAMSVTFRTEGGTCPDIPETTYVVPAVNTRYVRFGLYYDSRNPGRDGGSDLCTQFQFGVYGGQNLNNAFYLLAAENASWVGTKADVAGISGSCTFYSSKLPNGWNYPDYESTLYPTQYANSPAVTNLLSLSGCSVKVEVTPIPFESARLGPNVATPVSQSTSIDGGSSWAVSVTDPVQVYLSNESPFYTSKRSRVCRLPDFGGNTQTCAANSSCAVQSNIFSGVVEYFGDFRVCRKQTADSAFFACDIQANIQAMQDAGTDLGRPLLPGACADFDKRYPIDCVNHTGLTEIVERYYCE